MFSKNEQEPIWGVAGGGEAQVWSTEGPCSPPGFFFSPLWLKTDKDICDPSGYQDSHGNSLVSYSVLVSTRNWEEGSMFQIKIALFPGVLVFWLGMTAFFFFSGATQLPSSTQRVLFSEVEHCPLTYKSGLQNVKVSLSAFLKTNLVKRCSGNKMGEREEELRVKKPHFLMRCFHQMASGVYSGLTTLFHQRNK